MSDMKKFLIRKRRINNIRTIYYFKPIKCVSSDDEYRDKDPVFEFEKPIAIVDSNSVRPSIYFNYHHPNRNTIEFKYGKYLYGRMCLGTLEFMLKLTNSPKYPEMLYNYFSEYSNSGYWHVSDGDKDHVCPACGRGYQFDSDYCESCQIVDKKGF